MSEVLARLYALAEKVDVQIPKEGVVVVEDVNVFAAAAGEVFLHVKDDAFYKNVGGAWWFFKPNGTEALDDDEIHDVDDVGDLEDLRAKLGKQVDDSLGAVKEYADLRVKVLEGRIVKLEQNLVSFYEYLKKIHAIVAERKA